MSFSTVLIISLAAGVILIIGGGLMMYMANLVKSAYEIKVQINAEVEDRLGKMAEDLDKKSRWIKRDLLEEIEKIKANMITEAGTRVAELTQPVAGRLDALETALRAERVEWVKAVDSDRAQLANLDNRLKSLNKTVKKIDDRDAPPLPQPLADGTAAAAEQPAAPPPPPPAPKAGDWLPELGSGR